MAEEVTISRPAPFVEDIGKDLAKQAVALTGVPVVTGGIGSLWRGIYGELVRGVLFNAIMMAVKEGIENVALWNAATLHKEDVMNTMMAKMQKKDPEYRNLRNKNFLKRKSDKQ